MRKSWRRGRGGAKKPAGITILTMKYICSTLKL